MENGRKGLAYCINSRGPHILVAWPRVGAVELEARYSLEERTSALLRDSVCGMEAEEELRMIPGFLS